MECFIFTRNPPLEKTQKARVSTTKISKRIFRHSLPDSHVRPDFPPDHRPAHRALTDGRRAVDACADVAARVEQHGGVQVQAYLALPGLAKGLELHHKKNNQ